METKCVSAFGHFGKRRMMIFAEMVQDSLLLMKFAWWLLTEDVSHVYQKRVTPEVNIALHFLLKTWVINLFFFLCQNYALPFLMLKWFSEVFLSSLRWIEAICLVQYVVRGESGALHSLKTMGFCQVLSPTTYQFIKPTSGLTCSQW